MVSPSTGNGTSLQRLGEGAAAVCQFVLPNVTVNLKRCYPRLAFEEVEGKPPNWGPIKSCSFV